MRRRIVITAIIVFAAWFGVYLLNLSHLGPVVLVKRHLILGSDTTDIANAMRTLTFADDMRKHLLFSAFTVPLVNFFESVFSFGEDQSILVVLALISAANVTAAFFVLYRFLSSVRLAILFASLYAFMFANLVFNSIPETYPLANSIALLYVLLLLEYKTKPSLFLGILMAALAGIAALFNPPLLSLVVLQTLVVFNQMRRQQTADKRMVLFALLNVVIAGLVYSLPNIIVHGESFLRFSSGYFEKYASMSHFVRAGDVATAVVGFLLYSAISPIDHLVFELPVRLFADYFDSMAKILLLVGYVSFSAYALIKLVRERNDTIAFILVWMALLMGFYVYFNPREAVLYSSQITFPIVLLHAWAFSKTPSFARAKYVALVLFIALLAAHNLAVLYAPIG